MDFTEYIRHTTSALSALTDQESISEAAEVIATCQGQVITTGIGKAGHVARKMASTLSSLAIPSSYLHAADASHGDLGVVTPDSVLVAFSTSGKTREVLETIIAANKLGVRSIISITSHPDGEIRNHSMLVVDMGEIKEFGPMGLAPTTSTVVMLVISDFLCLLAAEYKGTTISEFAARHHSGYLGQKAREQMQHEQF